MQGIERKYCDVCINALARAWRELMEVSGTEALRKVRYGKGDTLGLDAITEITIKGRLEQFDSHAILITEELDDQTSRRWPTDSDPVKQPLMFFCDPTDRSTQLKKFIERISRDDPMKKIVDLMAVCNPQEVWEEMFESPVAITGPSSAITCVRKGRVVFSVILNHLTAVLHVAADIGLFSYQLGNSSDPGNEQVDLAEIFKSGQRLHFPGVRNLGYTSDDCKRFVTFLGKTGYRENFNDSNLLFAEESDRFLHHREPPGPPRALYLSELQRGHGSVGFILANGEKIGEWMHWLPFVKFALNEGGGQALRAYEIALDRPWTKDGMLMSTSPEYSLFCEIGGEMYLDISRLRNFRRPSQFRCMMVVVPYDNERIIHILEQYQHREITRAF